MADAMRETSKTGRKMVKGHSSGQTGTSTLEAGGTANSTALEYGLVLRTEPQQKDRVSGPMERGKSGYQVLKSYIAHPRAIEHPI